MEAAQQPVMGAAQVQAEPGQQQVEAALAALEVAATWTAKAARAASTCCWPGSACTTGCCSACTAGSWAVSMTGCWAASMTGLSYLCVLTRGDLTGFLPGCLLEPTSNGGCLCVDLTRWMLDNYWFWLSASWNLYCQHMITTYTHICVDIFI